MEYVDEVATNNVEESSKEGVEAEWNLSVERVLHPGVVSPIHRGKLVGFGKQQWVPIKSISILVNVHGWAQNEPDCVGEPKRIETVHQVEQVHLLVKVGPGHVLQLLNVHIVVNIEFNTSVLLDDCDGVLECPSVNTHPVIDNTILAIFVQWRKDLIDPVHFNPAPSVQYP